MTPAAAAQMRADTDAVLERFDAGMCRVLTKYAPQPEVTDSDWQALMDAVREDPLRRHFEDHEGEA